MERKKTRLNESEMKVMQIIWNAGHPITGQQVLGQITEQYKGSWHPRTIYPLMRKLSEKGMIRDVGSARVGKVYARQFLPAISRPEYMALLDGCYGEAAASAAVAFLISPIALPQLLMWVGNLLICAASALYTYLYRL